MQRDAGPHHASVHQSSRSAHPVGSSQHPRCTGRQGAGRSAAPGLRVHQCTLLCRHRMRRRPCGQLAGLYSRRAMSSRWAASGTGRPVQQVEREQVGSKQQDELFNIDLFLGARQLHTIQCKQAVTPDPHLTAPGHSAKLLPLLPHPLGSTAHRRSTSHPAAPGLAPGRAAVACLERAGEGWERTALAWQVAAAAAVGFPPQVGRSWSCHRRQSQSGKCWLRGLEAGGR